MTEQHSAENDALVEVILEHGSSGTVNSRDLWVGCLCGARLPVSALTFDGYADHDEEERVRAEHLSEAIRARVIPPGTGDNNHERSTDV